MKVKKLRNYLKIEGEGGVSYFRRGDCGYVGTAVQYLAVLGKLGGKYVGVTNSLNTSIVNFDDVDVYHFGPQTIYHVRSSKKEKLYYIDTGVDLIIANDIGLTNAFGMDYDVLSEGLKYKGKYVLTVNPTTLEDGTIIEFDRWTLGEKRDIVEYRPVNSARLWVSDYNAVTSFTWNVPMVPCSKFVNIERFRGYTFWSDPDVQKMKDVDWTIVLNERGRFIGKYREGRKGRKVVINSRYATVIVDGTVERFEYPVFIDNDGNMWQYPGVLTWREYVENYFRPREIGAWYLTKINEKVEIVNGSVWLLNVVL